MKEVLYLQEGQHCGTCGEPINHIHGKMVSCEIKWIKALMSKEEAIEFAKKYLEDRNDSDFTHGPSEISLGKWGYRIASESILLDIIPYLYGEALD